MTDFGYASDGTPVQWTVEFEGESDERGYWQDSWGNPYEAHEVAPARVVGPGQVVVDAADLRSAMHFAAQDRRWTDEEWSSWRRLYTALADADVQDSRTDTETEHAEPAPDDTPGIRPGESLTDYFDRTWRPDLGAPHDDCEVCAAAEPDRVTLPDTPWTTVRVTLDDGDEQVWYTIGEAGVWYDDFQDVVYSGMRARVVDFTILAEPPKADPAETDAPRDTITRANLEDIEAWATGEIEAAEDRAAKRGRDEALAVVGDAVLPALGAKPVYDSDTGAFLGAYTREVWDYTDE